MIHESPSRIQSSLYFLILGYNSFAFILHSYYEVLDPRRNCNFISLLHVNLSGLYSSKYTAHLFALKDNKYKDID